MGITGGLFALSTGANAIGTAANTYSQYQAQKAQGKYEQNQLNFNAEIARLQASDAVVRGEKDVATKKRQTRQVIGAQRAALAAQGLDVNSDTSDLIQQDTAGLGAEDVTTIRNNAWREAWGYRVQAQDYASQARFSGISSKFKQNQTLLTGGLQFARDVGGGAMDYYKYKKQGVV